jgi:hypothetical protein
LSALWSDRNALVGFVETDEEGEPVAFYTPDRKKRCQLVFTDRKEPETTPEYDGILDQEGFDAVRYSLRVPRMYRRGK